MEEQQRQTTFFAKTFETVFVSVLINTLTRLFLRQTLQFSDRLLEFRVHFRHPSRSHIAALVWLALGLAGSTAAEKPDPAEEYARHIRPILEQHCYKCHGPQKMKGGLNLATFSDYQKVLEDKDVWQLVLERIQAYEMPPPGQPELDFGKHERLLSWLRELPRPERADCDQIASDRTANFYRGYVMSRRLNRAEYHNTLRDLFGVELQVDDLLPADGGGGEGSDTAGNALFVSSIHIEKYLAAAEQALAAVLPE